MRLISLFEEATTAISETVEEAASALPAATSGGIGEWPVIKQIAWLFGLVMEGIFIVLSKMNILSVTVCIIVFTVVTKMLLLPLTIKQQRFTKISALMNPELQALQKKYEGRRDQVAMQQMRIEQQQIYDKYGSSMSAGCLPTLIQLPFLFGLYPVIYNMTKYVPEMLEYSEAEISKMYTLFGINLLEAPGWNLKPAIIIPILAGVSAYFSSRISQPKQVEDPNNPSTPGSSMKMMSYLMPFMSLFFCINLPAFLGVYWVTQSVVTIIQQLIINMHYNKIPVEDLIKQNVERANKKRAKKGLPPINQNATMKTKKLDGGKKTEEQLAEEAKKREAGIRQSTDYYKSRSGSAGGSLAAKANMVRDYNEKHK